ncbi:hypothetical protein EJ110_NYTH39529 [Nymphaea thermarum]|nr:hypothetical protein EJ110_NYTH39529 [Nymphaea thermarum]
MIVWFRRCWCFRCCCLHRRRHSRFRRCWFPAAAIAALCFPAAVSPCAAIAVAGYSAAIAVASCAIVVGLRSQPWSCLLVLVFCLSLVILMAEEMTTKIDVAFDTNNNTKSEHVPPLILRKSTAYDMWTVLARMYGRKKRVLRTYQIKCSVYSLKQGDLSVASFYAALKTKWEELDYHVNDDWNCGSDHALDWEKEWMDRTFIFLGGLRDEFESIRSQILNCDEIPGIEEVYARVESEEQRCQVMHIDSSHGSSPSAFVSRTSGTGQRPVRRCSHCNKLGHSVDFCWDIHPEKRLTRGRPPVPPSSRRGPPVPASSQGSSSSVEKSKLSSDKIKELALSPLVRLASGDSPLQSNEKETKEKMDIPVSLRQLPSTPARPSGVPPSVECWRRRRRRRRKTKETKEKKSSINPNECTYEGFIGPPLHHVALVLKLRLVLSDNALLNLRLFNIVIQGVLHFSLLSASWSIACLVGGR